MTTRKFAVRFVRVRFPVAKTNMKTPPRNPIAVLELGGEHVLSENTAYRKRAGINYATICGDRGAHGVIRHLLMADVPPWSVPLISLIPTVPSGTNMAAPIAANRPDGS